MRIPAAFDAELPLTVVFAHGFCLRMGAFHFQRARLGEVFGPAGAHARSAVGVAVLPLDAPVEVELVVEVG